MAGFRFRLQRLLDLRAAGTRERAADLGSARAQEAGAARAAEDAAATGARALCDLRQDGGAPLDPQAWEAGLACYRGLRGAERAARADLHAAQAATEAARGAFLEARRDEAVLQRLRQRRRAEWEAAAAAADQAVLDEAGGRRDRGRGVGL